MYGSHENSEGFWPTCTSDAPRCFFGVPATNLYQNKQSAEVIKRKMEVLQRKKIWVCGVLLLRCCWHSMGACCADGVLRIVVSCNGTNGTTTKAIWHFWSDNCRDSRGILNRVGVGFKKMSILGVLVSILVVVLIGFIGHRPASRVVAPF